VDKATSAEVQVSQNGQLLGRRGRSLPANDSTFDTHRDSITSRFDCTRRGCVSSRRPSTGGAWCSGWMAWITSRASR
jgi:hypothetical protein